MNATVVAAAIAESHVGAMTAGWNKLIRLVRKPADGTVRAFIGDKELYFVKYAEDFSRGNHTVTLTVPSGHFDFTEAK